MNILLLAPEPFYQERGTPIAVDLVLRVLAARGERVDVLVYHEGVDVAYPGVTIHRIPRLPGLRGIEPGPSWKKLVCDLIFFGCALRLAARRRYDVVHAVEESAVMALAIKHLFHTPYVYDMDSCLSEQIVVKYPHVSWVARWIRGWEARTIRRAEMVVPVCDAMAETAARHGAKRVVVLRDISLLPANGKRPSGDGSLRRSLGCPGPVVMYAGNLERYQGIDLLLESFALAHRRMADVHLVVIGGTPASIEAYRAQAGRLGLGDAVHFVGPKPVAELGRYLDEADVLVSPRLSGGNTPMKIYSYLDAGKAVLATDLPTHTQVLSHEVAVLVAPRPEVFADGLLRLLQDAALRRRLGRQGRALIEARHNERIFRDTLNHAYDALCAAQPHAHPVSPVDGTAVRDRAGRMRAVLLRAGTSITLLWLILRKIDLQAVGVLLQRLDWRFALVATGLFILGRWITTAEWRILLRAKGLRFAFRPLLRVVWLSNFFGQFLPAAVGGDSVRMVTMVRDRQVLPDVASSVLIERVNGALSLAALSVLGAVWSYERWKVTTVALALMLPLLAVAAVTLLLWIASDDHFLTWAMERLRWLPGHQLFLKVHAAAKAYRHQPRAVLASFMLSELSQVNRVAAVYLLAKALGITLFIGEALVLVPTALFISMLPVSVGGLGVGEGAFVLLLGPAGIGSAGAFAISLMSRVAKLLSFAPAVPAFLIHGLARVAVADGKLTQTSATAQEDDQNNGRPLRVLRVIDRLSYGDRLHGAGRVWLNSLPAFGSGCEVIPCVLRLPASIEERFAQEGIRLWNLKKSRFDPFTIVTFCRLIRRERVDMLHLEGYGASTFGRIAGILTGTPAVIHLHDMYAATPSYVRWCDWWLAPATARVVAVSQGVAEACATRLHIPRERIAVIPNAIPVGWAQPVAVERLEPLRRTLGISDGSRVIGTVAHLQAEKDVPSLLQAIAHLRAAGWDCHVVVVGEGPDRAQLEELIAQLGLVGRAHLVGFQVDVRPYLALMEVAVFSSLSEGCPNTLLEAMAMGRPIVATAARGIKELIRDGDNGLMVPVRDAQAIAQAVERLLVDPALAARLSAQVKAGAKAYQMPAHVARLQELYQQAIQRSHRNGEARHAS